MAEHLNLYIAGEWRPALDGARREIRCPADGQLVATAAEASTEDTHAAIAAAREAFDTGPWPSTPERERADVLRRTADLIDRDRKDFVRAEALDTGKRIVEAEYDMDDVVACLRYYAGVGGTEAGRVVDTGKADAISRLVYEPIGVCGLITPWNYPLLQAIWKVAPALLAGNTFVLKPSELTPSTAVLLMRALEEAGLPAGVANLVLGAGPAAGAPLSEHPDVDMVSFTGGVPSGTRVMAAAASTVKRVALELGGKNPNVVFADADFETAVDFALTAVFLHSGQVCSAGARLIVEQSLHDRFVDEVVARAERITLGGPFDPDAETGPLISAAHRDKVEAYVAAGLGRRRGAALRRTPTGRRAPARWLLLSPNSSGWLPLGHVGDDKRSRSAQCSPSRHSPMKTTRCVSPTTPSTGWQARSGPRTQARPSASRTGCGTGPSGSTTTTPTCRRPNGAG